MDRLVQQILQADPKAIEKFYLEYLPKIQRYLKKHLPSTTDSEVFANDIFLEAIDSLPLFEGQCSLQTWLYRIAHNKVVDFYRKKKITSLLISKIPFFEAIAQEVYQPEFQYEKNKLRDKIEKTLRGMSYNYRKILTLHYEDNLSVKEIAKEMNLTHKAAESLLFRARQNFKKIYAEE
ncbi:MAG TPA: RNA polymerase sigma factor [Patescibacteria group bacterium]|nr:RNA polymerase sigma factor [Patescibacteria group bacterium]